MSQFLSICTKIQIKTKVFFLIFNYNINYNTREGLDLCDDEKLSYDITDENGEEVDSGSIVVSPCNLFYEDSNDGTVVDSDNHPEYLLIISDIMKRSSFIFNVLHDFKIGEIHFMSTPLAPLRLLDWCSMFGDYVTSIGSFKYRGKTYYADDFCGAGSYGE